MPYYGVIEDIWELDYGEFRVHVFKCQWVNGNTGVRQDKLGFTLVDLHKGGYNTTHSSWQCKLDKCFMSKICATRDSQWFYRGEKFLSVTILVVHQLM